MRKINKNYLIFSDTLESDNYISSSSSFLIQGYSLSQTFQILENVMPNMLFSGTYRIFDLGFS